MNWAAIALAARRAEAAYIEDAAQAAAAFVTLGDIYVAQYQNSDHQAVVSRDSAGDFHLSISGTRFGQSLPDLFDDADIVPHDLGGGCEVSAGAYSGVGALWEWAESLSPGSAAWHVGGHSLGGQRALLTGLFLPIEQIASIVAFEAPKTGNAALWATLAPSLAKATCICNGEDMWFGWPLVSEWSHPPIAHIHLLPSDFEIIEPGMWPPARDKDDHAIVMVTSRLEAIATATDHLV